MAGSLYIVSLILLIFNASDACEEELHVPALVQEITAAHSSLKQIAIMSEYIWAREGIHFTDPSELSPEKSKTSFASAFPALLDAIQTMSDTMNEMETYLKQQEDYFYQYKHEAVYTGPEWAWDLTLGIERFAELAERFEGNLEQHRKYRNHPAISAGLMHLQITTRERELKFWRKIFSSSPEGKKIWLIAKFEKNSYVQQRLTKSGIVSERCPNFIPLWNQTGEVLGPFQIRKGDKYLVESNETFVLSGSHPEDGVGFELKPRQIGDGNEWSLVGGNEWSLYYNNKIVRRLLGFENGFVFLGLSANVSSNEFPDNKYRHFSFVRYDCNDNPDYFVITDTNMFFQQLAIEDGVATGQDFWPGDLYVWEVRDVRGK